MSAGLVVKVFNGDRLEDSFEVQDAWQARRRLNRRAAHSKHRAELWRPNGRKPMAEYRPSASRRQWLRSDGGR